MRPALHVVRGDERSRLHDDHGPSLRAFALRLSRNAGDADDLVQDTLTRALARWDTLQPGTNTRSWLLSILHNLFIDRCRRQAQEGSRVDAEAVERHLAVPEPEAQPAWAKLDGADVERAMAQLDPTFRDVYRLHTRGRSYEQIASELAIPRATVGTRLLRARKKLKTLLFGQPEDES